jgi:hypothetical protein
MNPILRDILDLARWAPSGDNEQPWRFIITSDTSFIIRTDDACRDLYSKNAWPTYLSLGFLSETIALAAGTQGMEAQFTPDYTDAPKQVSIRVDLVSSKAAPDPLANFIKGRSVSRRRLSRRALHAEHKARLQAAVGDAVEIVWITGFKRRLALMKATLICAFIRLTIPETFPIHTKVLHWKTRFSEEGIPDAALGACEASLCLARFGFRHEKFMYFVNRYMGATIPSHIEMDILPHLFCGAHFYLKSSSDLKTPGDFVEYGRKVQRFWLTATSLGIQHQPNIATLAFSEFGRMNDPYTVYTPALRHAKTLSQIMDQQILEGSPAQVAWTGRLGYGPDAQSRSLRLPLDRLIISV